jgi:hypothetical protein
LTNTAGVTILSTIKMNSVKTTLPASALCCLLLILALPSPDRAYMNDLMARYASANSLAAGGHNILFSDGMAGVSFSPARLTAQEHPGFLACVSAKGGETLLLNALFAAPLRLEFRNAFSANLLYIREGRRNTLSPELGFGAAFGPFETGASASVHYNLEQKNVEQDFLFFKLAAGFSAAAFRAGVVFENETTEAGGTIFLGRVQAGTSLLRDRLRFSAGLSQYFKRYYIPVVNVGWEAVPWDFVTITGNIEGWDPSFGFVFNSNPVKMCIAAWYHHSSRLFDYSLSLTFRR